MRHDFRAYLSHILRYELSHCIGCLFLHPGCDVGVCAEGKARIEVPQHTGDRLDVHAVLQGQRGEGVAKLVEAENEAILVEVENKT